MKGDFTRSSFEPAKRYTGVRMQQGRVQLDADWNEQNDIVQYQIRTPFSDILGPRALPAALAGSGMPLGFAITLPSDDEDAADDGQAPEVPDFSIGPGRCYLDGMLCENDADVAFSTQPDFPGALEQLRKMRAKGYTDLRVYLEAWTRHITALEDPDLRERALDGPDTTTRTKTIWQVKLAQYPEPDDDAGNQPEPAPPGTLNVKLDGGLVRENQLYRVEVQRVEDDHLFFKWSRENGSVAYGISSVKSLPSATNAAAVSQEGVTSAQTDQSEPDPTSADGDAQEQTNGRHFLIRLADHDPSNLHLVQHDWVEFVSDPIALDNAPQPLLLVTDVQLDTGKITVYTEADEFYFDLGRGTDAELPDAADLAAHHAYLRRWDQRDLPAEYLFSVDSQFVSELDQSALPGPLRAEFQSQDRPLSGEATVKVEEAGSTWKIVDAGTTYLIKNENQTLNVYPAENVIGCIRVRLNADKPDKFMPLESGLSVQFESGSSYAVGDYWMIPTRVQFSRDEPGLLWPTDANQIYRPQPPQGAQRRAAPLARLCVVGGVWTVQPCAEIDFESLPLLTAGLSDLTARVSELEEGVTDLQQRVETLEEKMTKVLAWMKIERTMLFEDFHSEQQLLPGEVVALDPDYDDHVVRAETHQERVILGVVAEFPTECYPEPEHYRVAMSGRTTCRVVGEVNPGDLLIPSPSSDYPGYATAAGLFVRPGTVIGRALTGFTPTASKTSGEVNALITMG